MPTTPVNKLTTPSADAWYDHKVYVAKLYSITKSESDLSSVFANEFVADINGQNTTSVSVRLRPELTLADLPTTAEGLAAPGYTSVTGGSVDIVLGEGKYYNVPIDTLGVKPAQATSEFADAAGRAVLAYGNAELMTGICTQGTKGYFGSTFSASTANIADKVWKALLAQAVAIETGDEANEIRPMDPAEFVLDIDAEVWSALVGEIATLRTSTDAFTTAKGILGVSTVRKVALPKVDGKRTLFVFSHRGAVAQAKVTQGPKTQNSGFISSVLGAVKATTKVLAPEAVRVTLDGTAPAG